MEWWWTRGVERSKTKRGCLTFFNLHFLDQEWSKYLEFTLAKLRGLCKCLANVYNLHSHVYGLHCLTFVHENKAENQCNEASRPSKRAQRYLTQNMEKSLCKLNLLHCRQNHNLFMKWRWKGNGKNKENAVRLIVHGISPCASHAALPACEAASPLLRWQSWPRWRPCPRCCCWGRIRRCCWYKGVVV